MIQDKTVGEFTCELVVREGVSSRTQKPYRMLLLKVDADEYGPVEILLDTFKDRAGIVLDMLSRKEV